MSRERAAVGLARQFQSARSALAALAAAAALVACAPLTNAQVELVRTETIDDVAPVLDAAAEYRQDHGHAAAGLVTEFHDALRILSDNEASRRKNRWPAHGDDLWDSADGYVDKLNVRTDDKHFKYPGESALPQDIVLAAESEMLCKEWKGGKRHQKHSLKRVIKVGVPAVRHALMDLNSQQLADMPVADRIAYKAALKVLTERYAELGRRTSTRQRGESIFEEGERRKNRREYREAKKKLKDAEKAERRATASADASPPPATKTRCP